MESNNESAIYHVADKYYVDFTINYQKIFFQISRTDATDLINSQFLSVKREFELPEGIVLRGHTNHDVKTGLELKYDMSRESFNRFVSTKRVMKPTDFDKNNDAEFYDGVQAILVYDNEFPIYQLVDDRSWEYDTFSAINKKFGYIRHNDDKMIESDCLQDVEMAAFKHYFEINDPLYCIRANSKPVPSKSQYISMRTNNNHSQLNNVPLRLTEAQKQNPMLVLNEFFECYQLNDIRDIAWKWLVEVLTSSGNISIEANQRANNIFFYEIIETLIEACFIINQQAIKVTKVA